MINYEIYAMGAALVDTEITVEDSDLESMGIEKGVMTLVDEARQADLLSHLNSHLVTAKKASGGSAANSIVAAQYLGARTFFSCQVADDEYGQFFADDLMTAGVDTQALTDAKTGTTGKCLVLITPDAERTMNTHLGISETLSNANINLDALKASKYAYIEGYLVTSATGKPAAISLREQAQAAGVKVAVSLSDPAMAQFFRDGLKEIIGSGVDLIFCNEAEAKAFTEQESLEAAADALKNVAKTFVITRGKDTTWIFDGQIMSEVHPMSVKPVDTNGAGDMFAGAFLASINQGRSFADAAAFANRAAAKVVTQFGPRLAAEQYQALKEEM